MDVVIVGGTAEGRELAAALVARGHEVVTTLAGATSSRAALPGRVRVGGFGSQAAMAAWLARVGADAVVDATHPFAAAMTQRVTALAQDLTTPMVRLDRPGWGDHPDAARWRWVGEHDEAVVALAETVGPVLLAIGRQEVGRYAALAPRPVLARVIDAPEGALPAGMTVLRARGPFTVAGERALVDEHGLRVVVTKDAGGSAGRAKLDVAAERGLDVVMIARPPHPAGLARVPDVAQAVAWVEELRR